MTSAIELLRGEGGREDDFDWVKMSARGMNAAILPSGFCFIILVYVIPLSLVGVRVRSAILRVAGNHGACKVSM